MKTTNVLISTLALAAMLILSACTATNSKRDAAIFDYISIDANGSRILHDFDGDQLAGMQALSGESTDHSWQSLKKGKLILRSSGSAILEADRPAFLGIAVQQDNFYAQTEMDYSPNREGDIAGLVCYQQNDRNIVFGKTTDDAGNIMLVVNKARGTVRQLASATLDANEAKLPISFKLIAEGPIYSFLYSTNKGANWNTLAIDADTSYTAEGMQVGLYHYRNTFPVMDALQPWEKGAFDTRKYRNLFAEAGYPQAEIDRKLNDIFQQVFYGPDRVYFEVGDSLAYISDLKNHDVRTEGMSYGMMIAVQFGRQDIFDRLWRWSVKYMQHHEGPLKGYFAWSLKTSGERLAQGPASDGELYFVTALLFASNIWGNEGEINYLKEAQHILNCSWEKDGTDDVMPLIDKNYKLITFVPTVQGGSYTDLSYHIPAFYEVWARWANDGRSDFYRECASAAREFFHKATDPRTGLNPDQSEYDGSHRTVTWGPNTFVLDQFRFDSWRVPMNVALDYSWSNVDGEWQRAYADRIQDFLYLQGLRSFVDQYNVDGSTVQWILPAGGKTKLRHSVGLVATAAAVSLASSKAKSREFIDHFWNSDNVVYDDGYFDAYYDGLLRLFAFMHLSGNYKIIFPQDNSSSK
ncbi:MAG: hypothetical protein LBD28_08380 [Tannerellaceae bacterium]|nr:hypothetical protein [Tannerellaceae bacterium]